MKHLAALVALALFVTFAASSLQAAEPEPAEATTPAVCTMSPDAANPVDTTGDATPLAIDFEGLNGRPFFSCNGVGPCDDYDDIYCNYSCVSDECCKAVILIPNSYCPDLCY